MSQREDIPHQYTSIEGCLTPSMPRGEDMRLKPSLNITPEGSLTDILTVVKREMRELAPKRRIVRDILRNQLIWKYLTHV